MSSIHLSDKAFAESIAGKVAVIQAIDNTGATVGFEDAPAPTFPADVKSLISDREVEVEQAMARTGNRQRQGELTFLAQLKVAIG